MGTVERDGDVTIYRDTDGRVTSATGRTSVGKQRAKDILKQQQMADEDQTIFDAIDRAAKVGTQEYYSADWLTGMLYTLMRDAVPTGEMERIVKDMEQEDRTGTTVYSNGHLARYAKELADRIRVSDGVV